MNIVSNKSQIKVKKEEPKKEIENNEIVTTQLNEDISFLNSLKGLIEEHGISDSIKNFIAMDQSLTDCLNLEDKEETVTTISNIVENFEIEVKKHSKSEKAGEDGDDDGDGEDGDDDGDGEDGDDDGEKCPECPECPKKGDPDFDDIKGGKMHKILGIDEGKDIDEVYKSGEELAKALLAKTDYLTAMRMLVFAANFTKGKTIFQDAVDYLKAHPEDKKDK